MCKPMGVCIARIPAVGRKVRSNAVAATGLAAPSLLIRLCCDVSLRQRDVFNPMIKVDLIIEILECLWHLKLQSPVADITSIRPRDSPAGKQSAVKLVLYTSNSAQINKCIRQAFPTNHHGCNLLSSSLLHYFTYHLTKETLFLYGDEHDRMTVLADSLLR
jgi:hypothetical protein